MDILNRVKMNPSQIAKGIAFILFVTSTLFIGIHHEYWTDEAQSWLIARDVNVNGLFRVMAYEGSPILWPLVLKCFIFLGLPYRMLFIVPFLFSTIGVWLIIYRSKLPTPISITIPFTYYIFYQYTIIARNYCLILPIVELIAISYHDRLKRPYIHALLLILLANISVHMTLLSGILFLFFCMDLTKQMKISDDIRESQHGLIAASVIAIMFVLTANYLRIPADHSFQAHYHLDPMTMVVQYGVIFGELLAHNGSATYLYMVLITLLATVLSVFYRFSPQFLILSTAVWSLLSCIYYNKWHVGMVLLSVLLAIQLYPPKSRGLPASIERYRLVLFAVLSFFICIQLSWSVRTASYDYANVYSGAEAAAMFIKENGYDKGLIYGVGFPPTALSPYFDRNIYSNKGTDTTYYVWRKNKGDMTTAEMLYDLPDVLVVAELEREKATVLENAVISAGYSRHVFEGASYIKDIIYEPQTYYVYVKDDHPVSSKRGRR